MHFATTEDDAARTRRPLTKRQAAVYEFICDHVERFGYPPTIRGIGEEFGIASPNGVECHLRALAAKGYIERDRNQARAIRVSDLRLRPGRRNGLRILGRISAGGLFEAIENQAEERFSLSELFAEAEIAAVVDGDGFRRFSVVTGDVVLFARGQCIGMIRRIAKNES